ncbi:MAG: uridine kinase [Ilumatobacteraceae bacterium]
MSRGNATATREKPFVIGVAGGTCSGKTTVTERLEDVVGADRLAVIKQDSYYIRRDHQSFEERAAANYDHPDAFDWDLTNEQLHKLISGETVEVPVYDYPNHNRSDEVMVVKSAPIIVFEGILALYDENLRNQFDLKVFVDTDADIRFIRRLQRDVVARGRTPDSIINQYLTTVRPSHLQFIEPSKRHADVIFPEGGHNNAAFDVLLARVLELLG